MNGIVNARTFVRSGISPLSMPTFCKKKYAQLCQLNGIGRFYVQIICITYFRDFQKFADPIHTYEELFVEI